MNPTDPQTFFDKWLSAYSDRLHVVRRGSPIDLAQPEAPKPPLSVSSDKSGETSSAPPKPNSA
ncbi:MAG TPA: hypothetical protein VI685_03120 [Candidatus Angelobacter sp.]